MPLPLPQMLVIPAHPFLMGTPERELSDLAKRYGGTRESYREESPQHEVLVPAFALARTPVTNRLYAAYIMSTSNKPPLRWRGAIPPGNILDHPVVDVSWNDAYAFCAWLNAQPEAHEAGLVTFRLPSEAEWEHAARGGDGRTFPWGNTFHEGCANTREHNNGATLPVGSISDGASPYGVLDMAGNVWEWTASLDGIYPYSSDDGREQRSRAGRRILRGGCYANPQGYARCACRFRLHPLVCNEFTGFRLAASVSEERL